MLLDLKSELAGVQTVGIAAHVRPDGDAIGSCLGLLHYIKKNFPEISARAFLEEVPEKFRPMAGEDLICCNFEPDRRLDVFISLDCADEQRLGKAGKYFKAASRTICIDHHISNPGFADVNLILPEASSTCEILFSIMEPEAISRECAEAIFMGIVHDTGVFRHSCTAPSTFRAAAVLLEKGIDSSAIINDTYYDKTYYQKQIQGRAMLESILLMGGKVIFSVIRKREMDLYQVEPADLDGIVSELMGTSGVEVAIFLYETDLLRFKVSLRSRAIVDVSKIAAALGGGGHVRAAGCTTNGNPHDIINSLTGMIEQQLG